MGQVVVKSYIDQHCFDVHVHDPLSRFLILIQDREDELEEVTRSLGLFLQCSHTE